MSATATAPATRATRAPKSPEAAPAPAPAPERVQNIPLDSIQAGNNDRLDFDPVELRALADSMIAHGLAQPITVRPLAGMPGRYEIVAGERRSRAARLAGWHDIPAIVRDLSDEQAAAVMLLENIQRVDLNPMDEARAYRKRADQFGWTPAQLAKHAQVTEARVYDRLALLKLIEDAQLLVKGGSLKLSFAAELVQLDHNRQYLALAYLNRGKNPTIGEFRAVCGKLLTEQMQEAMFDPDQFLQQIPEAAGKPEDKPFIYPVDPALPVFKSAPSIDRALEQYIAELTRIGSPEALQAARVVGTVYKGLVKANLVRAPKSAARALSGKGIA